MKKMSRTIFGVILVTMAGFSIVSCSKGNKVVLETVTIERGSLTEAVTASGTVKPVIEVEVGTQVSGIIDKIYVDYNSVVKKGELIAELEIDLLEADLNAQKAQLESSKTQFEYQTKNYQRIKELYEEELVSDSEFDDAEYQYYTAKSTYEMNEANFVRTQANYNYAKIYSPIDGVVLSKAVEEGQTVASSFNTPTLFTIANDLTKMWVIADVDESDIGQVADGQHVTFYVDSYLDLVFEGEVLQVRMEANSESSVVTYEVVVDAPNDDLKLKPGMTAYVSIYTLEKENVITVSNDAVKFLPNATNIPTGMTVVPLEGRKAGMKTVWVVDGDSLREREVTLGSNSRSTYEVLSGLSVGDVVVVGSSALEEEVEDSGETNPFMPSPRRNNNSNSSKK